MPLAPVRTVSRMALRSMASRKASSLDCVAGQLDGVALLGDVDDAAAEDVGHALHLLALLADRAHLHEHELALGVGCLRSGRPP
jgi:diphthamide biosynthesis methyltransferase